MKFAGKDILSTEGVKLSGAVVCSATVNGSTLWRHPATAAKGVNILVDEGILYKKRGIGMFVSKGAKDMILNKRKGAFYENYVKSLIEEAKSIGITTKELIKMIEESES